MEDLFTYDPFISGVKGLVFIGDKLLIYRRDTNTDVYPLHLDVPGGGSENNETPFETFQREMQEEFGLTVRPEDMHYKRRYSSVQSEGKFAYFVTAQLPAITEQKIHFGDEGTEYMHISLEDYLASEDAWPLFQERTLDYLKTLDVYPVVGANSTLKLN